MGIDQMSVQVPVHQYSDPTSVYTNGWVHHTSSTIVQFPCGLSVFFFFKFYKWFSAIIA